jgi:thiamine pyridinylase
VRQITKEFRSSSEGRDIELDFIDLTEGYYDSLSEEYLGRTAADVYEIDSVLLPDLVAAHMIRPLPAALTPLKGEFLESAQRGARVNGMLYGYPQWVCAALLFYRSADSAIANANTLSGLKSAIACARRR